MKGINFLLVTAFFILFYSVDGYAQQRRAVKGDQAFELKQYSKALEHYKKAYSKANRKNKREGTRILFQTAMCYKYMKEPRRSEAFFRRAVRGNYPDPVAIYYLGEALMQNGKYDLALAQFKLYKEKAPDDWRGQHGIDAIEAAQFLLGNPGLYEVGQPRILNSRMDDFAPTFGDTRNSMIIFTSSRDGAIGKNKDSWTGNSFTSLFVSFLDRKGEWSTPVVLDEGPVNTEFNEGAPALNVSGTELYFTRCLSVPNVNMGCRIYVTQRAGANWSEPREVVLVSDSTISIGHPAVSMDDMRLYFVSDMPGGFGGKDIWYAERERPGGDFLNPKNLGPVVNTPGDEMFPSVREDGTLYFSSNGHPGLGGLDIFLTREVAREWTKPENLGTPVNSAGDDFGITFRRGANSGFFSSNRVERGVRGDAIFTFELAPVIFTLQGTIRDDSTKTALSGAQIQLIGSDGSFSQAETNATGNYSFDQTIIKQNTNYQILVSKDKYFNVRGQETTVGIVRSRDFVNDFYLVPIPARPIELPEILYEFARWELLPQYKDSLNGLINILEDNPGLIIELASHTDSRGTDDDNDVLSQRRAQSVVNYLIEQGIDQRRLVAKGYGKRVPKVIERNMTINGYTFRAGTVINDAFIRTLPNETLREIVHQMNRRTEFRVISDDFRDTQRR
jgi:peptidoglycan-associated lipoprotein